MRQHFALDDRWRNRRAKTLTIEDVRRRHENKLMTLPHVVGVGIGERDGKPVIEVLVKTKDAVVGLPPIPESIEGYPVTIVEAGDVTAQHDERESDAI